jgi:hypothetical protein
VSALTHYMHRLLHPSYVFHIDRRKVHGFIDSDCVDVISYRVESEYLFILCWRDCVDVISLELDMSTCMVHEMKVDRPIILDGAVSGAPTPSPSLCRRRPPRRRSRWWSTIPS